MPTNVPVAAPTTVLPFYGFQTYSRKINYPSKLVTFSNGEIQVSIQSASSHKEWSIAQKLRQAKFGVDPTYPLGPADLMLAFYNANVAKTFYFYDVWETSPKFSYDTTGTATAGRKVVKFKGPIEYSFEMSGLIILSYVLIERA